MIESLNHGPNSQLVGRIPSRSLFPMGKSPAGDSQSAFCCTATVDSGAQMLNQFRSILPDHALVAPTGYMNSWNICAEGSDVPDWDMLRTLVDRLGTYENVNRARLQLQGSPMRGLVNTAFVLDPPLPVEAYVAVVSHFNVAQYHEGSFYRPNEETDADAMWCGSNAVTPPTS